jgi:hypothetical protein
MTLMLLGSTGGAGPHPSSGTGWKSSQQIDLGAGARLFPAEPYRHRGTRLSHRLTTLCCAPKATTSACPNGEPARRYRPDMSVDPWSDLLASARSGTRLAYLCPLANTASMEGGDLRGALEFWRAAALVPSDRAVALRGLQACFAAGSTPKDPDGPHTGRLVMTTLDLGLDVVMEAIARLWMPWKGKTFEAVRAGGWNLFTPGFRRLARVLWPSYDRFEPQGSHSLRALRFVTEVGASRLNPDREVLSIVYDLAENPSLVRSVVDELILVADGLYLGQVLRPWRGTIQRAGWFALERAS